MTKTRMQLWKRTAVVTWAAAAGALLAAWVTGLTQGTVWVVPALSGTAGVLAAMAAALMVRVYMMRAAAVLREVQRTMSDGATPGGDVQQLRSVQ